MLSSDSLAQGERTLLDEARFLPRHHLPAFGVLRRSSQSLAEYAMHGPMTANLACALQSQKRISGRGGAIGGQSENLTPGWRAPKTRGLTF